MKDSKLATLARIMGDLDRFNLSVVDSMIERAA